MEINYQNTVRSLNFLMEAINRRLKNFFDKAEPAGFSYPEIRIEHDGSPLSHFIANHRLNLDEYLVLLLSLVPHLQPNFLDTVIQQYLPNGGEFPEFGGVKGTNHRGTIPTGETALFIIAGNDVGKRMQATGIFSSEHFFAKENILALEPLRDGEPRMSGRIILQPEYVDLFTLGALSKPLFGAEFPAKNISTKMDWGDLVLNEKTEKQINDIKTWLDHNRVFMTDWGMDKKVRPGYRVLFHGPPGTGKTLTATLLGKQFQKEVYRIDLSQVVSKYIGETEKNLEKIFAKAENKDWMLFFDEADALFGKRSNVQNAHDKYANQEISYLLQRVEDFPGLIILASNYKNNIDQAFVRRFNTIVHFPMPNAAERLKIWQLSVPPKAVLSADIDLAAISSKYELSGSAIINVIHYASIHAIKRNSIALSGNDIREGIRREYEKEERVFAG